ncbi:hypothetical protein KFL_012220010, partial [Klebsormidium nitens]
SSKAAPNGPGDSAAELVDNALEHTRALAEAAAGELAAATEVGLSSEEMNAIADMIYNRFRKGKDKE